MSTLISINDLEGSERKDRTHGEDFLLLSEDGNRNTNFAGCVREQFEIMNVTGTLQDLDAKNDQVSK